MTNDIDIYRTAKLLLDAHGEAEAWRFATARAIDLHIAEDMAGRATWQRVLSALHEMTRNEPMAGEPIQ
jgi:hypothetical protein